MSDWKEENIEMRKNDVEERIRKIRDDAEKNEVVIRKIDNENMSIYGLDSSITFVDGQQIPTRGCLIVAGDNLFNIRAGASGPSRNKEIAHMSITGSNEGMNANLERNDREDILTINFEGEDALDKAMAVFGGIALYLEGFKEERLKKRAKAKEMEDENAV